MKILLAILLILFLSGCQSIDLKDYYLNGQVKSVYKQSGALSWSNGKQVSFEAHGL